MNKKTIKCCKCGSKHFYGHRVYHLDVLIDSDGYWLEDKEVYDAGTPFGPFTCSKCGKEYNELSDIPIFTLKKGKTV